MSGNFVERPDGEPYRVQLRSMWNQWESAMRHFEPHSTSGQTMERPQWKIVQCISTRLYSKSQKEHRMDSGADVWVLLDRSERTGVGG